MVRSKTWPASINKGHTSCHKTLNWARRVNPLFTLFRPRKGAGRSDMQRLINSISAPGNNRGLYKWAAIF